MVHAQVEQIMIYFHLKNIFWMAKVVKKKSVYWITKLVSIISMKYIASYHPLTNIIIIMPGIQWARGPAFEFLASTLKSGAWLCISVTSALGGGDRRFPGAHWPASLANQRAPRSVRVCLNKNMAESNKSNEGRHPKWSPGLHMHTETAHIHPHTHGGGDRQREDNLE